MAFALISSFTAAMLMLMAMVIRLQTTQER
jgi:hypothetical protein